MKSDPNQLSLFEEIKEELFRKKADGLLNLLNMDLKPKDQYIIHYYYTHKDLYILIASDRHKHIVCNMVNDKGEVPSNFSVNWRTHNHILQELKNY